MTKVPLLDLKAQYASIRDEVREAMDRVCDSQHFILGPEVKAFEEEVAHFCGARFGVGVSSGTDALLAALMACNVRAGDEVITVPYSFFATAGVIARLGARPVFVDVERGSFNMDGSQLEPKVSSHTKVVMPVHLFGRCAAMASIHRLAAGAGLAVIEDAAQAIGARDDQNRQAGTLGGMGCFSFFPSKNLGGFGDGGMVVTNDQTLAEALQVLRVHGSKPKYYHRTIGGNFRLDAIQAAVLRVKLKHLPRWTETRRRNAQRYNQRFQSAALAEQVILPEDTPGHIYNQYVVRVPRRDALRDHLKERGVETEIYYPLPLHLQPCFAYLGYRKGEFPESELAAAESLALPVFPEITEAQQAWVVESCREFFRR